MGALNLQHLLGRFDDHWSPRSIATLNDDEVKLVKAAGEFVWHTHDDTELAAGVPDVDLASRFEARGRNPARSS